MSQGEKPRGKLTLRTGPRCLALAEGPPSRRPPVCGTLPCKLHLTFCPEGTGELPRGSESRC